MEQQRLSIRIAPNNLYNWRGDATITQDNLWYMAQAATPDEPALSIQTTSVAEIDVLRLVPMIHLNGKRIYLREDYYAAPTLNLIAPNAVNLKAEPQEGIILQIWFWVIDGQTLGGSLRLQNNTDEIVNSRVEMYLQGQTYTHSPVTRRTQDSIQHLPVNLLELQTRSGQSFALQVYHPNVAPVLLLEGASGTPVTKLSYKEDIAPQSYKAYRFVQCTTATIEDSLDHADIWLHEVRWGAHLKQIAQQKKPFPEIETGDDVIDAALVLSQQLLLQHLTPEASDGYFLRSVARREMPEWADPWVLFQHLSAIAVLDAALAQRVILNLTKQYSDARGQLNAWYTADPTQAMLPMLAQLVEIVHGYSQDNTFVAQMVPRLLKAYAIWFGADDDRDGYPEWQSNAQMGRGNINFHSVPYLESPDLATYLLQEGAALKRLALISGNPNLWLPMAHHHQALATALQHSWQGDHFAYQDCHTHAPQTGYVLVKSKGDTPLTNLPIFLPVVQRLMLSVDWTEKQLPPLSAQISGLDADGKAQVETFTIDDFVHGKTLVATSQYIWSQVTTFALDGLSKVYDFTLSTTGTPAPDFATVLPYITDTLTEGQYSALYTKIITEYLTPHGLKLDDTARAMPLAWAQLIGLGLLSHDQGELSADLWMRIARTQAQALLEQGAFFSEYDARLGIGYGFTDHLAGALDLHWLVELIGVRIINAGTVVVTGAFNFANPVNMVSDGVTIQRSIAFLRIVFPTGFALELPADVENQVITDPDYDPTNWESRTLPKMPRGPRQTPNRRIDIPLSIPVDTDPPQTTVNADTSNEPSPESSDEPPEAP